MITLAEAKAIYRTGKGHFSTVKLSNIGDLV